MARKINVKLVLELCDVNLSRNMIASTWHLSRHSVSDVFHSADEKCITYQDICELSEEEAYRLIFPDKYAVETMYLNPDYEYIHKELKKVGVTLKLLWQEYQDTCKTQNAISMGYTKFCQGYGDYTIANKLTNHLNHKPRDVMEVDWSGPTMQYCDVTTGDLITAYLFVATLPYSQYTYVEACRDMKMDTFLHCHVHMYHYF